MTNLPVFFISVAARAARESMLLAAFLLPFMTFMGARDFGRAIFTGCRAEAME